MSFTITGQIKSISQAETKSNFTKREFVLMVQDGNYSNDIALQFTKDKVSVLDNYNVGQMVKVDFNIQSKEFNGRYFTNLTAWKIQNA